MEFGAAKSFNLFERGLTHEIAAVKKSHIELLTM